MSKIKICLFSFILICLTTITALFFKGSITTLPPDFNWQEYVAINPFRLRNIDTAEAAEYNWKTSTIQKRFPYKFNQIEILIYSGEKTGSSSLFSSFKGLNPNTFQVHGDFNLRYGFTIYDNIINVKRPNKLLIISSYREPISRCLSAFFEGFTLFTGRKKEDLDKLSHEEIDKLFLHFIGDQWKIYHPFLEKETRNFDYVNVYSKPFNQDKGYQIYETDKVKIILLRFDKIDLWEQIIRENTEFKNFILIAKNVTDKKKERILYKEFLNRVKIPIAILDKHFTQDEKNLSYFYSNDEMNVIKNGWYEKGIH